MKDLLEERDVEQSIADQPRRSSLATEFPSLPSAGRPLSINQPSFYEQILSFTQPTTPAESHEEEEEEGKEKEEEEKSSAGRSPLLERTIDFRWEQWQMNLIESETKNCLTLQVTFVFLRCIASLFVS